MSPDWSRPSTFLLVAVLAANLVLPLAHYWPERTIHASSAKVAVPAGSRSAPSMAVTARRAPARPVEPVDLPVTARRVAHKAAPPVCRAWGPFTDVAQAESVAAQLALDPLDFEVFESEVRARPDYLVTVQTPGPRRVAIRTVEELSAQGVESYLLDRPGNVLAVGVFSNQARAETQRRLMDELGFAAVVEPLDRSHQVYHLMARVPADVEPVIPPAAACGEIAPMEQFL